MGARRPEWLELSFWEPLERLESRHRRAQSGHRSARGRPEGLTPREAEELKEAWQRYREVIAELERSTAAFDSGRGAPEALPDTLRGFVAGAGARGALAGCGPQCAPEAPP